MTNAESKAYAEQNPLFTWMGVAEIIRKHQDRANTFLQAYLRYDVLTTSGDATDEFYIVEDFLSNFIVTKHIASSKAAFSSYNTALKHFYTFLNEVDEISDD